MSDKDPYVYGHPTARGRVYGAAQYIRPTGPTHNHYSPNRYYNSKNYTGWEGDNAPLGRELREDISIHLVLNMVLVQVKSQTINSILSLI